MIKFRGILYDALYLSLCMVSDLDAQVCFPYLIILRNPITKKPCWVFFSNNKYGCGVWKEWKYCIHNEAGHLEVCMHHKLPNLYPCSLHTFCFGIGTDKYIWCPDGHNFEDASLQSWSGHINPSPLITHLACQTSLNMFDRLFWPLSCVKIMVSKRQPIKNA
jgi:hypothetical protein